MASKLRIVRESQKTYWEKKLDARIEVLRGSGMGETDIHRDIAVRKLKAKVKDTVSRLRAITARAEKLQEMARVKEEKKAAPVVKEKGRRPPPRHRPPRRRRRPRAKRRPRNPRPTRRPRPRRNPRPKRNPSPRKRRPRPRKNPPNQPLKSHRQI